MKKIIIIAMLVLSGFSAQAQLLWKVSGNGAEKPSYLFGTHHVAPMSMLQNVKGTMPALESVQTIMGEVDMVSNQEEMMRISMTYAMAPADSTLTKVLTPEQIAKVDSVLAKYSGGQLSTAALDMLKPAMVSTQLAMLQTLTAFPGYNPQEQLDQTIQQVASANSKKIEGLESIESQFKLLMGNPISEQAADLIEAIENDDKSIEKAQKLADAYMNQDLATIEEMMLHSDDMEPEEIERLITNRNNNWVKTLTEKFQQEPVFVAVGVGHFVGEKGLINQLKEAGFTVEPVQ